MAKKSNKEYRLEVGENGKPVKVYIENETAKKAEVQTNPSGEKITFFNQIKLGNFKTKSQFWAIILATFGGMFSLHDFYLGTKNRVVVKLAIFAVGIILGGILFWQVSNESAISYNMAYQSIMLLPFICYFLIWSYDFITLATKKSSHFKTK